MSIKGRNPTKEETEHMDKVSELGCIVCRNMGLGIVPAEIHHIEGKTNDNAHFKVLPLCFGHHREGGRFEPMISRHPYKRRFESAYGTEEKLLEQVNNILKNED
tara:strand:- start:13207 stop:13518 length:312 start_codon:yes stop_codon:yes gene_type:complete